MPSRVGYPWGASPGRTLPGVSRGRARGNGVVPAPPLTHGALHSPGTPPDRIDDLHRTPRPRLESGCTLQASVESRLVLAALVATLCAVACSPPGGTPVVDNYLTFRSNSTYTDYVGADKCDIYETNIDGTWTLSNDGKILTLKSVQGIQAASIEITESKLVLTITDDTDIIIMTCIPYP